MDKKQEKALKWPSMIYVDHLLVYRKYNALWDIANENYMRKIARQNNMINLRMELIEMSFQIPTSEVSLKT